MGKAERSVTEILMDVTRLNQNLLPRMDQQPLAVQNRLIRSVQRNHELIFRMTVPDDPVSASFDQRKTADAQPQRVPGVLRRSLIQYRFAESRIAHRCFLSLNLMIRQ